MPSFEPDEAIVQDLPDVPGRGYSIRVASRMTGLSVDTLRMWERRYDFPSPVRNAAGNRQYVEADVERLVLISRAMKVGYRAGEAIRLSSPELLHMLASQPKARGTSGEPTGPDVERLLNIVRSYDVEQLRAELRRITGLIGAKRFVLEIAGPLTEAVGDAWSLGDLGVRHEHLVTDVLAAHLRTLAQQQELATGPRILLTTLPREQHALGLEMAALMASMAGASVVRLGPDSPTGEIVQAVASLRVQAVALSISLATAPAAAASHVEWLAEHLPPALGLWLGGKGAKLLDGLSNRVRLLSSWQDLDDAIEGLSRGL